MKRILRLISCSLIVLIITQTFARTYSSDPKQFITEIVDEAKLVLNSNVSKEEKAIKLSQIALNTVDIKGIGYYTLGSKRKELSPEELNKYEEIFQKYFLKSFTSRLTDYSDPKITVLSSEKINEKYTIVKTLLLATEKKPEVKIDWRVYTKDQEKPLIRDLIVEGLRLARTQKEEFGSILSSNNNDINALFEKLEEFINQ